MVEEGNEIAARFSILAILALILGAHWTAAWLSQKENGRNEIEAEQPSSSKLTAYPYVQFVLDILGETEAYFKRLCGAEKQLCVLRTLPKLDGAVRPLLLQSELLVWQYAMGSALFHTHSLRGAGFGMCRRSSTHRTASESWTRRRGMGWSRKPSASRRGKLSHLCLKCFWARVF